MTPSSRPPRERRVGERRSGSERRAQQRRAITDRRYSTDRRSNARSRFDVESPMEHIRNAMQMLATVTESPQPLAPAAFAERVQAALERLTRALADLEQERRR